MHVYFSVLNWLFPERVGKKYRARYDVPLKSEYVIDVGAYLIPFKQRALSFLGSLVPHYARTIDWCSHDIFGSSPFVSFGRFLGFLFFICSIGTRQLNVC